MVDPALAGLAGGFVGTVAMTVPQMVMGDDDPTPTEVMMSKINRRPPEENQAPGALAHFFYGTAMGLVFAVLVEAFWDPVASFGTGEFTLIGVGWGFALWLGSFFWMGVLGIAEDMMDKPMAERVQKMGMMGALHLVYGAVAGVVTILVV